ncbi:MAG: hypothetical protein DRP11_03175 [Candidatus Aenigmatarchaeota archaeon]|nr:MAG: hypothetical protein DRP11_03175 [Candidatus Aenigmarchaeota archaeon]
MVFGGWAKVLAVIVLISVSTISIAVYILYIPHCPLSCDDGNDCTNDYCGESTGFRCDHAPIPRCCGNGICELPETPGLCPLDCPKCDDGNDCTDDYFSYEEQRCKTNPIPNCCGNGICEHGEYKKCDLDCPTSCDDSDPCTYDFFNTTTMRCEHPLLEPDYLYKTDFNMTDDWYTGNFSIRGILDGKSVLFIAGTGLVYLKDRATFERTWKDYIFRTEFRIDNGTLNINFRQSGYNQTMKRYYFQPLPSRSYLLKSIPTSPTTLPNETALVRSETGAQKDRWHRLKITAVGNKITIFLDNEQIITYTDPDPIEKGSVSFEAENLVAWIDYVQVIRADENTTVCW